MKYAVVERERRFLPGPTVDLSRASRVIEIEDRYLTGTRLRVRSARESGKDAVVKLGQKIRFAPSASSALAHTTMYLDEGEHALLSSLPAAVLTKTRHLLSLAGDLDVAVDVFHGRLRGLTMAEVDLGHTGTLPEPVPGWLGVEVTDVEEFTGSALAGMDAEQLATLLAAHDYPSEPGASDADRPS